MNEAPPPPTLAELHDWSAAARPVFICGVERGGTSALLLAFARHPELFAVGDVYETFVFARPRAMLADPPPPMLRSYLRGAEHLAALRSQVDAMAQRDGALSDDDLIRFFFWYCAHRVYPGQRPLEKTPAHVQALPRIRALFPHARVLVCTRDPAQVAASYRRRLQREQQSGGDPARWRWLDQTPDSLIQKFRKIAGVLREERKARSADVFQVPYDWLTGAPEEALRAMCAFAGLAFDPLMLQPKPSPRRGDVKLSTPIQANETPPEEMLDDTTVGYLREQTARLTQEWSEPGPYAAMPAPTGS